MDASKADANAAKADQDRVRYGFWVVVIGLVVVLVALGFTVWRFTAANDVAAVLGLITSVVGTVVGAFFGIQVGAQGKEKADNARQAAETEKNKAQERATALAGALGPDEATRVLQSLR